MENPQRFLIKREKGFTATLTIITATLPKMAQTPALKQQVNPIVPNAGSNISSTETSQISPLAIPETLSLKEALSEIKRCNAVLAEHRRHLSSINLTPKNK